MSVAVIFPGQGTQRPGMGREWHDHPAWSVVDQAEAATGRPLARLLLDADAAELSRTTEAQFAVFLTSLVAWVATKDRMDEIGPPVAFAGHSLGQVTALVAAGALTVEEGAGVVADRAGATQAAADRNDGCMAALLGADLARAQEACEAAPGACWVANDNAPGQVVVGGTAEGVATASERAQGLGVRKVVSLDVGGAFHTPLMEEARAAFSQHLEGVAFAAPAAPVVHNADATPHADDAWRERLAEHLVRPVRWRETLEVLVGLGASSLIEVGPGSTLSGMARRTVPQVTTATIGSPADLPALVGSS